jgi:hypothetical protein
MALLGNISDQIQVVTLCGQVQNCGAVKLAHNENVSIPVVDQVIDEAIAWFVVVDSKMQRGASLIINRIEIARQLGLRGRRGTKY